MKQLTFISLFVFLLLGNLYASHIKGGLIEYTYSGAGTTTGTSNYSVTVTIFYGCNVQGPRSPITLRMFDAVTYASAGSVSLATSSFSTITKTSANQCMSNPPTICYEVYKYMTTITLPNNTNGYIISVVDQYRTSNIVNIANSSASGIVFTANIPGTISGVDYHTNSSPRFIFRDTAIICYNGGFTYEFNAVDDTDHDSLSYAFGNGLNYTTSTSPPYASLTYNAGYTGALPMGANVSINPVTGLIAGNAPATTGEYVIAVYVTEWRNGVAIDRIKKELQIYVYNCSLIAASLQPSYINCNSFTSSFQNESTASNINQYTWDFGVKNSSTDTSTSPTPSYTYADTGTYTIKLKVSSTSGCEDSTTAQVKIYPGFTPNFTYTGSCFESPFIFKDATMATYGQANSWSWDFGDLTTTSDTSTLKNTQYKYASSGTKTVVLNVTSSKGCAGNVSKIITVNNKPQITLPFHDTLICSVDTLPLLSSAIGQYSWSPNYNISDIHNANPLVWPKDTTTYIITVTDGSCVNSDSIKVNVLNFITVDAGADIGMCLTDTVVLNPVSHALQYVWSPPLYLINPYVKNPHAVPAADITYYVTANLGKCQDKDSVHISLSPYPKVYAGRDTSICYGDHAQLQGTTNAAYFAWKSLVTLTNAGTLSPTANPLISTSYILTVTDTFNCKKPVSDTVLVTVIPRVIANAGRDTSVVLNQALQLHASGALNYVWTPATYMNNPYTADPIVTFSTFVDSIRYYVTASTAEGCHGTDDVLVKVFKTGPEIFVPSAFTPNGDGQNDVLRPITVGIQTLSYFKVFNRYGQLIFSTNSMYTGWNGTIKGTPQPTGAYVYMAQGTDYLGHIVLRKGTSLLIR